MADEQTPEPFGDAVDPSGTGPVDSSRAEDRRPGDDVRPSGEADNQVAAKARSSRPVRRTGSTSAPQRAAAEQTEPPAPVVARPVRRDRPASDVPATQEPASRPSRRDVGEQAVARRTTPGMFVNQSVGELRKVIWPTANQLRQYFIVVLLFVLFIVAYVGLLDAAFGWTMLKLFGNK